MTTAKTNAKLAGRFRFPDPPERTPEMTSFNELHITGKAHYLSIHLSGRPNTLVAGEHYLSGEFTRDMTGITYPDLIVAFDADLETYQRSNAYVVSEQGKPPDFALEIASTSTRRADRTVKRESYAALGITEYWRFDRNPNRNNPGLAGDRLTGGQYQPVAIDALPDGRLRGYIQVLNLIIEWNNGQLEWIDPATDAPILTYADQRDRADWEHLARMQEREARLQAEERAEEEQRARMQAEARARELEEELQRLKGE
jgi:hypothetical protein